MSIFTPTPTYVFESISFGEDGTSGTRLCARKSGFFAWLSKLINRQDGSGLVFEVQDDRVFLDEGWRQMIPARQIANVCYGYTYKHWLLLLAVVCVGIVIFSCGAGIVFLLLAAVFAYLYSRSRTFVVEVIASSGEEISFNLKRSDFGGAELPDGDIGEMMRMVERIAIS